MEQFLRPISFVNLHMVVVVGGLSHSYFDTVIIASLKLSYKASHPNFLLHLHLSFLEISKYRRGVSTISGEILK